MNTNNLVDALINAADENRAGITLIKNKQTEYFLSYKELLKRALCILMTMCRSGVKSGDEVLIFVDDIESYLCIYWACLFGKFKPVSVPSIKNDSTETYNSINKIRKILVRSHIVTTKERLNQFSISKTKGYSDSDEVIKSTFAIEDFFSNQVSSEFEKPSPEELAMIQFSSGSTGDPKGVGLTHDNIISDIQSIIKLSNLSKKDKFLSWLPLSHNFGMIAFHLMPIYLGVDQFLMPPQAFLDNPLIWMDKVSEHKITTISTPNFGLKAFLSAFNENEYYNWNLSSVSVLYNGSEAVSYELIEQYLDKLSRYGLKESVMMPSYGMAEATVGVSITPPIGRYKYLKLERNHLNIGEKIVETVSDENSVYLADLGYAVENCSIKICDEGDEPLPERTIGCIQLKGRIVTKGYYRNESATKNLFTKDGWLRTGDLGFLNNNRLTVTGRLKDIIIINGINIYPTDLEELIENEGLCGKSSVAACGVDNEKTHTQSVLIFVQYNLTKNEFIVLSRKISSLIASKLSIQVKLIIPVSQIPKTESGKVQRQKLRDLYLSGQFDEVITNLNKQENNLSLNNKANLTLEILQKKLISECCSICGFDGIGLNDDFIQSGANSVSLTEFADQIAEEYVPDFVVSYMFATPNIDELSKFIMQRISPIKSKLQMAPIQFENKYIKEAGFNDQINITISLDIERDRHTSLVDISRSKNISINSILFSLFAVELAKFSGNSRILTQTMLEKHDTLNQVELNIDMYTEFYSMAAFIDTHDYVSYNSQLSLSQFDRKQVNDIFVITYDHLLISNIENLKYFDYKLRIAKLENNIGLSFQFNKSRVSEVMVKETVADFDKLLNLLISEYSEERKNAI